MGIFLVIYFLLFLGLSIKKIKWAVFLILFTLPAYLIRFELGWLPMTLLEGEILILFLVWAGKTRKQKNKKTKKQENKKTRKQYIKENKLLIISAGLFLLAATISMFIAPELRVAAGIWKAYFIEPVLFLLVFISVIKRQDLKKIFYVLSGQVLVLSLFGLYQKITGNFIVNPFWAEEATRRITSFYPYPNALALYLAPVIILLLGFLVELLKQKNKKTKKQIIINLFLVLIIVLGLLAVYFTKSKGAMAAMVVGIIFYALFYKNYRKYFAGILVLIILAGGYLFVSGKVNLMGAATVEGGDSITTRVEMWGETLEMLKTRPILGAGLSGYPQAVASYHKKDYIEIYLYPHNIFLNFWSETGLLGLIAFVMILIWFYKIGFEDLRFKIYDLRIMIMAAMTVLLIHGLVDVPYFKNDLSIFFWLLVGAMIILNKKREEIVV